jgi:dTDP-4-amino-4,6-dideoxygalactose transaminase
MAVPFVDLRSQYDSIAEELKASVLRALDSQTYVLGPEVEAFEEEFAAYCGVGYAVGVNSGTAALHLALLALGVGPGDEVITVANTFIATAEAISAASATPVFVDVDPHTYLMDPSLLEAAITPRTRAIIPVHLYGQVAEMDAIRAVADGHNIPIVEDACQAHGATYRGQRAGSLGAIGCFSFYPSKNLGAVGEAGMAVTNSPALAQGMRTLRDHGQAQRYYHDVVGYNYRMSALQGAALRVKLPHLDEWNARRHAHAQRYTSLLAELPVVTPVEAPASQSVYHLYVVRVSDRDALRDHLAVQDIGTGIHYPVPIHLQAAYADLGYGPGVLPVTEAAAGQIVSLPMYAELSDGQIEAVVEAIARCPGLRRLEECDLLPALRSSAPGCSHTRAT